MPSLHISPVFVARASETVPCYARARAGAHGLEDGEGVGAHFVGGPLRLSRPEGGTPRLLRRRRTASVSASAIGNR